MKHSSELSTYTASEFKAMAKATLKDYRKMNPDQGFFLDKSEPWFVKIYGGDFQLSVQIVDKGGFTRQHTILL